MLMMSESLGEDINNLQFNENVWKSDNTSFKSFTDRVTDNFNMLCALMIYKIGNDLNSTCIYWRVKV